VVSRGVFLESPAITGDYERQLTKSSQDEQAIDPAVRQVPERRLLKNTQDKKQRR